MPVTKEMIFSLKNMILPCVLRRIPIENLKIYQNFTLLTPLKNIFQFLGVVGVPTGSKVQQKHDF